MIGYLIAIFRYNKHEELSTQLIEYSIYAIGLAAISSIVCGIIGWISSYNIIELIVIGFSASLGLSIGISILAGIADIINAGLTGIGRLFKR